MNDGEHCTPPGFVESRTVVCDSTHYVVVQVYWQRYMWWLVSVFFCQSVRSGYCLVKTITYS